MSSSSGGLKSKTDGDGALNIFFDTEFTHLWDPLITEPPSLISIGCIADDGRKFYAENADYKVELCSHFVREVVLPLLEGGQASVSYQMLATQLYEWVLSFNEPVRFITDSPNFDWPHIEDIFNSFKWPENLEHKPVPISFSNPVEYTKFLVNVEHAFTQCKPPFRRHHALDDAIANQNGFKMAMDVGF